MHTPFEHGRIRLRRFRATDLEHLLELETDEQVMQSTGIGRALEPELVAERLQRLLDREPSPYGIFAAELVEDGSFVAWMMLLESRTETPEIGFMLPRRLWGHGLATEAAEAMAHYAFDALGEQSVCAMTNTTNAASMRVLEKIGMTFSNQITVGATSERPAVELNLYELERDALNEGTRPRLRP